MLYFPHSIHYVPMGRSHLILKTASDIRGPYGTIDRGNNAKEHSYRGGIGLCKWQS